MLLLPLLLTTLVCSGATFDQCEGEYCPPLLGKPHEVLGKDGPAPILLGRDDKSGCICRENPSKYAVCFGRDRCTNIPTSINVTAPLLKITGTQIIELKSNSFSKFRTLREIQIEGNFQLEQILPGAFHNLTALKNLSISYNSNLKILLNTSFEGLTSLRHLFLNKNGFQKMYHVTLSLTPRVLPNLTRLSLNENSFIRIDSNDFKPMVNSSLKELNLVLCRIEYIHPEALLPLKNLEALRLGENSFNSSTVTDILKYMLEAEIHLNTLNLFSVGLRTSPPKNLMTVIANSNITSLNLARNQFEVISADTFPYMPMIQVLDLREVSALTIKPDAFMNLPKLKTLLLSGNKLATIPQGVLLKNLIYLDLQENSGNLFLPSYFAVRKNMFSNMKKLLYLNLGYNGINQLPSDVFVGLSKLKVLGLKNATIFHIANGTFSPLKELEFLSLENNFFASSNYYGLSSELFLGLDNLQVLLLGGCRISYLSGYGNPFKYLVNLKHLGLERNLLVTLSPMDFAPLKSLEITDLSYNMLIPWKDRVFESNKNLSNIVASANKLTFLSTAMLDDFLGLEEVDLSTNPFVCDCKTFEIFDSWSYRNTNTVPVPTALCSVPDRLHNYSVMEYFGRVQNQTISCKMGTAKLAVLLPLILLLVVFVFLASSVYYYRHHVRYWIFLTRLYLSRKGEIKPKTGRGYVNYQYDAFVSYSNEDRNFVVRLVTMLENYEPYLKLCVYERDFQIGSYISESVLESVARSRKILLVVSDNYAKSQWCRWESQIAEHHRLFFENKNGNYVDDMLVMVKLGPVSENHLTPTLRYLLKTRIYLQWEGEDKKQKMFWDKLRNALGPPKHVVGDVAENTHL